MNDFNAAAMTYVAHLIAGDALRRARDIQMARHMMNHSFREMWLRRRCQLCAKEYIAEPPPHDQLIDNRPRVCPDCMTAIQHFAAATADRIGVPIPNDLALALAGRYITHRAFQYGRPWQDHVPTHQRHLIGETP